jgi:tetratricopeptide (TPR) repeat protein
LALDREDTLKKAEKLLRQGRLDAAIVEYVRVVEDQPRDWNTANTLGDLYQRAGQADKAVAQYTRIAEHFLHDGFYPKAAALFKKILKLTPDDESAQLNLAELSARQGLLRDAKAYFSAIEKKRRAGGNNRGANEILIRLGDLDPADIDARLAAAHILADGGDDITAAERFRAIHADLLEKGRGAEAMDALREAIRSDPTDFAGRAILAKAALEAGEFDKAREYLDRDTAGTDPALLLALSEIELRSGQLDSAREILRELLAIDREQRHAVVDMAWNLSGTHADAGFVCVDAAVNAAIEGSDFEDAAAVLQEFVTRVPDQIPALLKLVEICVDGGLENTMYEAQAQLADAYLSSGQAAEARVIAEDLVAREPWERAHIERFRRALVMLRVSEPDSVIAERLSGQSPFTATDHFTDAPMQDASFVTTPAEAAQVDASSGTAGSTVQTDELVVEEIPLEATPVAPMRPAAPTRKKLDPSLEIDLTSVLGELEAAAAAPVPTPPPRRTQNLDDVFQDFRSDAAKQSGPDQSAQHMKLAETYLEMGMTDEAFAALRTAARSPRQRFQAGAILGRLYRERGDPIQAIEWMERAAEAPAPTTDEGRALLYDLGETLEAVGETARALAVFLELQADAGEYRDVAARIDHLSRVQTGG